MIKIFKRESRLCASIAIGILAFFLAGMDSLSQSLFILAVSNFLLAGINAISFFFIKEKILVLNVILFIMNASFAFIISLDYYMNNKKMLPIVWFLVGVFYIVIMLKTIKENKRKIIS